MNADKIQPNMLASPVYTGSLLEPMMGSDQPFTQRINLEPATVQPVSHPVTGLQPDTNAVKKQYPEAPQ